MRRFIQCDVFSPEPTLGNALAVVVDGEGLSDALMRHVAAWTNLAETTFLLAPMDASADYRVRIFTPAREMPFAGHPTLGSCAAWLASGGVPRTPGVVRQECGVGIVEVTVRDDGTLAFRAPPTTIREMDPLQRRAITDVLGIADTAVLHAAELDNGPVWQAFQLASAAEVLALDASRVRWPVFKALGFIGAHPPGGECDYEVRMLAPSSGMSEDPITGSLNSALAHWMLADGRISGPVTVAQGTSIGRKGRVWIRPGADAGEVSIGGHAHVLVDGTLAL